MKANELMIGDWVCYCKPNNYYTKVKEIKCTHDIPDDVLYYIKGQRDNRDRLKNEFDETFVVDILSPIPLTREILERNGFGGKHYAYLKTEDDKWLEYYYHEHRLRCFWNHAKVTMTTFQCTCKYVHELQHALRLCNIDKMIEL